MQAFKKALLDLRTTVLAELVRRNMLTADEAARRDPAPPQHDQDAPAEPGRRTRLASRWRRLIGRRPARQRKPPIWPMPEHPIKSDNAPDDRPG